MLPGINELLLTLVLIVAIGVATRIFGDSAKRRAQNVKDIAAKTTARRAGVGEPLKRDPETGIYEPETKPDERSGEGTGKAD